MRKFSTGFLIGAIFGGSYALLHSPASGNENRKRFKKYIIDITRSAKKMTTDIEQLQLSVDALSKETPKVVHRTVNDITTLFKNYQADIAPRLKRIDALSQQLENDLNK